MYFNMGMDIKYPPSDGGEKGVLSKKSHSELKALKKELEQLGLIEIAEKEKQDKERKKALADKFGAIE